MNTRLQTGLSILELMIAVAIISIVVSLGVPGFMNAIQSNRMASNVNDLVSSLHSARSEALKRSASVTVCTSNDPFADPPVCNAGTFDGWVVFVDDDVDDVVEASDGNGAIDAGEEVLIRNDGFEDTIDSGADGWITSYGPSGFRREIPNRATFVRLCDERGNENISGGISAARVITVGPTGRPQILRTVADVNANGGCP